MPALLRSKRFGWAVIFALVTAMALISYLSGTRYLAAMRSVEHTSSVERAIDAMLSLLKDAETAHRGYMLTGEPQFLQPYDMARREVPPHFAVLSALTAADPVQAARTRALRKMIDEKYQFIDETIQLRRRGDLDLALPMIRMGRGRAVMDRIRAECRLMSDHELAVLSARKREAERALGLAIVAVSCGLAVTILLALLSLLTVSRDLAELKQTAAELADSEQHYRLLTEQSSDLVRLLSLDGAVLYVSPSVERILGYTVEEYLAQPPLSLLDPDEVGAARRLLAEAKSGETEGGIATYRLRHKSGEFRWFEVRWGVIKGEDGAPRELHTAGRDVTERREAERQLNLYADQLLDLSLRDELTGLYNRRGFFEVAAQARNQALRDARPAALIFVDLNGMKRINDELGHDVGDLALVDAAQVLKKAFRAADVIGRLGGDELVAFALDFTEDSLDGLRRRLRDLADVRVTEHARPFRLSFSVGAALLEVGSGQSLTDLVERADVAMYEQKKARRAAGGVSLLPPAK
jgi:diguanylate cyclase (GGDEF)-like protein/PAS domain S-box-containing protein